MESEEKLLVNGIFFEYVSSGYMPLLQKQSKNADLSLRGNFWTMKFLNLYSSDL